MKKDRILVKVGTNVLTRANGRLDYNIMADLTEQILTLKKEGYEVVLVSSGANGAGREFFEFSTVQDPLIRKQMLSAVGQGRIFQVYGDFLREQGVMPAQALLTRKDFHDPTSYNNIKTTLENLLAHGVLPIINENDVVSYAEYSFGDNDQLAALTAILLEVDQLIILSDIEGFFTADPHLHPAATLIEEVEEITPAMWAMCEDSFAKGGTGGMYSKLKAAELATSYGIPTRVTAGKKSHCLLSAIQQGRGGTHFRPQGKRLKLTAHGKWVQTAAQNKGTLVVDGGAEKALKARKSLLAVGLIEARGDFAAKEVVLIQNEKGIRLGAGLVNQASPEIGQWLQKHKPQNTIVIHANHLYLL